MARLLVLVEGPTEEKFVNELLRPHLSVKGYHYVSARIMGNARQRSERGGIRPWESGRNDIKRHLKNDPGSVVTTMIDYYGLPGSGQRAWPGRAESSLFHSSKEKAEFIENAIMQAVVQHMGGGFDQRRFVPYVVMHEFEGLLFSDCSACSRGLGRQELESKLREIRDQFNTPEEINDSPTSAPSKRLEALFRGYEKSKPLFGVKAAQEVGLKAIREQCPNFDRWLKRLESIGA